MAKGWKEQSWVPSVLVLHEHHGVAYMDASTETSFALSVLKIIKGRINSSEWYQSDDDKEFKNDVIKFLKRFDHEALWELLEERNEFESERVELVRLVGSYMKEE